MYLISFIITYFFILKFSKDFGIKLDKNKTADLLLYFAAGMIICSRLVYTMFYKPDFYLSNPVEILKVWKGGLSFHGGLIGIILGGWIFCKRNKIPFLKLADLVSIPASIGLFFGRVGNFINGELVGRITDVPWCFKFKNFDGCRHPSQLYEAFKNLMIFGVLFYYKDKKKPDGFLFFLLIIMYSVLRSIIEMYRQYDRIILGMTEGQFLNLFLFIFGIVGMYWIYKNEKK